VQAPPGDFGRNDLSTAALTVATPAEADRDAVVGVLARAFRDNPLTLAIVGANSARRLRSNLYGMGALLPVAQRHGLVLAAFRHARVVGTLLAAPPYTYPFPPAAPGARLRCLLGQGWRVSASWHRTFAHLDGLHPQQPHWYLGTLGVDPPAQNGGVGRALLREFLACADADGLPAYLETDRSENVAFYRRNNFEISGRTEILGIRVWCMLRAATTP
jgi:ribosomal protein S18 acetylase RimI-like enzyme